MSRQNPPCMQLLVRSNFHSLPHHVHGSAPTKSVFLTNEMVKQTSLSIFGTPCKVSRLTMMAAFVEIGGGRPSAGERNKAVTFTAVGLAILLVLVANQHGRSFTPALSIKSAAAAKAATHLTNRKMVAAATDAVVAQTLMQGPPLTHTAAGTLAEVKLPHLAAKSIAASIPIASGLSDEQTPASKVRVRLYMESKCPACKMFTSQYVNKVLHAEGVSAPSTTPLGAPFRLIAITGALLSPSQGHCHCHCRGVV